MMTSSNLMGHRSPRRQWSLPSMIGQGLVDDNLRFTKDGTQMVIATEGLRVDLVDILGARRPRGEPPVFCHHLDAADRRIVARGPVEDLLYLLPGQFGNGYLRGRQ